MLLKPWWDRKSAAHKAENWLGAWLYTQQTSHRRKPSYTRRSPR